MRLDIIPELSLENPTDAQIQKALERVYAGEVEAVILATDDQGPHFMQVASGGFHVEYKEGEKGDIFAAEDVSLPQCQALFLDYARSGTRWKTAVDWHPYLDHRGQPLEPSRPSAAGIKKGRKLKTGQRLLAVALGLSAAVIFCKWITLQPLKESLLPGLVFVLALLFWLIMRYQGGQATPPWSIRTAGLILLAVFLFSLGVLGLAVRTVGVFHLTTLAVLALTAWMIYTAYRNFRISLGLAEVHRETEANRVRLDIIPPDVPETAPTPVLNYTYLGSYHGQYRALWLRFLDKKVGQAIQHGRLRLFIHYLPSDPEVHRVARIKIER